MNQKSDSMETCAGIVLIAAGAVVLLVANAVLRGFVLSILWGWFLVPVFSLPAISIPQALGIALVIGMLTGGIGTGNQSTDSAAAKVVIIILGPLFTLLIGWIYTLFL